ncbi:hypothetical protein AVEN_259253-1 [Araneus ventricosus]|uniref:C2H2-type domain-containing protein n=1 Tax=Araneus ventricosus TaxID=182803 RepID=A0A4Y2R710_ARAVE|nr:hypothetical protein AVEN_259253-1 [Araneus ventricosus]
MLTHGSEPGPSHETQSWSDNDVEWMYNVPMRMMIGEPDSSHAPSGFGYIEPTSSSLVPPSTSDHVSVRCVQKDFSNKSNLKRHMKKHGEDVNHACSQCNMKFYRVE